MCTAEVLKKLVSHGTKRVAATKQSQHAVSEILQKLPLYEVKHAVEVKIRKERKAGTPPANQKKLQYCVKGDSEVAKALKKKFMSAKKALRASDKTGTWKSFMKDVQLGLRNAQAANNAGSNTYTAVLAIYISLGELGFAKNILREMDSRGVKKNRDTLAVLIKYYTSCHDASSAEAVFTEAKRMTMTSDNLFTAMLRSHVALSPPQSAIEFYRKYLKRSRVSLALVMPVCRTPAECLALLSEYRETNPTQQDPEQNPLLRKTLLKLYSKLGVDGMDARTDCREEMLFTLKKFSRTSDYEGMVGFLKDFTLAGHTLTGPGYASVIHICMKCSKQVDDAPYATAVLAYQNAQVTGLLVGNHLAFIWLTRLFLKYNQLEEITRLAHEAAGLGIPVSQLDIKNELRHKYHAAGVPFPMPFEAPPVVRHFRGEND
eukprot:TRINITY_DN6562_c0_g1_i1.p1 TRINITY_DN6562_c0_g1~~TRINITY_DN6562_c0_g1_i1.p1  ORF type:complete len:431 (+),score=106.21 TRINITY_DN6562_c0_g1_i1:67-1359(+)